MTLTDLERNHSVPNFTKGAGSDEKFDMTRQINSSMSIQPQGRDELENKLHNIKGSEA